MSERGQPGERREPPGGVTEDSASGLAVLRLVPFRPAPDGEVVEREPTPLIREFKGYTVTDPAASRAEPAAWLPTDESAQNLIAGPGSERRRSVEVLWPVIAWIVVVAASALWIAIF